MKRTITFIAILIVSMFITMIPAYAVSSIDLYQPTSQIAPDVRDYATETFADPWDMDNSDDLARPYVKLSGAKFSNGIFSARTASTDSYFFVVWPGYSGAYPSFKEGAKYPINTNLYKRLSFRMYYGGPSTRKGVIYWYYNQTLTSNRFVLFDLVPGWNTYKIDLPSSSWNGKVLGLRINPGRRPNTLFQVDWIRLTGKSPSRIPIEWYQQGSKKTTAKIYLDSDNFGYDGSQITEVTSNPRVNSYSWDPAGVKPGFYYFYMEQDNYMSNYSGPHRINQMPIIQITDPDETGGADWATSALRNPWDFSSRHDVAGYFNVRAAAFRGGIFSALNYDAPNASTGKDDPYVFLHTAGRHINANKYHRLTFRYNYQGGFSLARGTMSRFGWLPSVYNNFDNFQISRDIVTYAGWRTYTFDLKKISKAKGNYGWKGYVKYFRFDPHEDPLTRRFYVDNVKLAADDTLKTSFNIRFKLADSDNSTSDVSIYYDKDKTFGNGNEKLITTGNYKNGDNAYNWKPSRSLRGVFNIYVRAGDSINTNGAYSTGPLRVHM